MKFGADSEEVYDQMVDSAIEEIDRKPPLVLRVIGWPIAILGFAVMSVGLVIWTLGRRLTGFA